jgi:ATP-dependent RNA helicase SUPV3L1/SUV3
MNSEEIMNLKYDTSEKIHKILKSQIKTMKHKCKRCSKELAWDFPFNICDDCHKK